MIMNEDGEFLDNLQHFTVIRNVFGTLIRYWWDCKLVEPLWKTVWRFLKKLKIELQFSSVQSFSYV